MQISVSEAKAQLTELVRRAEAGDEIILTRHGRAVVRLAPLTPSIAMAGRGELLRAVQRSAAAKRIEGTDAARSQDHLYDEAGLPG